MNLFDRWPNFKPQEVLSPDGLRLLHSRNVFVLRIDALDFLQLFRERLRVPLVVNYGDNKLRGYRSPKEAYNLYRKLNADAGKVLHNPWMHTFHSQGVAFDIHSPSLTVDELHAAALQFGWKGVGHYKTFIHVDLRDGLSARW